MEPSRTLAHMILPKFSFKKNKLQYMFTNKSSFNLSLMERFMSLKLLELLVHLCDQVMQMGTRFHPAFWTTVQTLRGKT